MASPAVDGCGGDGGDGEQGCEVLQMLGEEFQQWFLDFWLKQGFYLLKWVGFKEE